MDKLIIIDGNSLLNRAYYALPPLATSDGKVYNAVFGFVNIVIKLISEEKPSHMVVAFDAGKKNFRHDIYKDYKGTRKPMPPELFSQLEPLKNLLKLMNIKTIEKLGIEADDIIGTIAKGVDYPCVILSGDRDLLQLIDDKNEVWLTKHGISEILSLNTRQLKEEMGLSPSQIIDIKALMGDASDNIPGVAKIGEKTAKTLLEKYETLDGVYQHLDELKPALKETLTEHKDMAYLSYTLATIKTDCDIDFCLDDFVLKFPFSNEVYQTFKKYEFSSLLRRTELFEGAENTDAKNDIKKTEINDILSFQNTLKQKTVAIYEGEDFFEFACDPQTCYVFKGHLNDLSGIFQDKSITKIVYRLKPLLHFFDGKVDGKIVDLSLMAYLINSNIKNEHIQKIFDFLSLTLPVGANAILMSFEKLLEMLKSYGMESLYFDLELPICYVLFGMEKQGVCVDEKVLEELNQKYEAELNKLPQQIYDFAGEEFNINSPKKLGEILFDKMHLSDDGNKKHSTAVDKLEELKNQSPIIELILRYRTLAKLKSTYIEGLRGFIKDGKIHTSFNQTLTVTGRLSSTDPNLQNIPVRTQDGKFLRKVFTASKGCKLLSADYSQIELRLLAHYSQDKNLISAYNHGLDIHAQTASQIFNVPYAFVTDEERRTAKAVNFGIIYGMSAFGLSKGIGISVQEAKNYIDTYFMMYPTIKDFLQGSVEKAKQEGFVSTLLGRRRNITEIFSTNHNTQMFGERAAMNMPLQGTASDIIKLAMLKMDKVIAERGLKSKLILQIHDELIFDVPENEVEEMKTLVKDVMENVVSLNVPLLVDIEVGKNWFECAE